MADTNISRADAPKPKRKRRRRRSPLGDIFATIGKVLGTLLLVGLTTGAILTCFGAVYIQKVIVPQADVNFGDFAMDLSTTMYYTDKATGSLKELRTIYGGANRVLVSYDQLPENLVDATIAIEDKRFMKHHGVDWIRTVKSAITMFTGGDVQGGSTITQQLIKNTTTEDEITVHRKILEIFRALEFEKKHTKEEIIEWYLNYIYLGSRSDGVATASYTYFGKDVSQLDLAECASLISITNNPSIYNPYLSGKDENGEIDPAWGRKNNAGRAKLVLWNMLDQEKITQEEHDGAVAEIDAGLNYVRGEGEKHEEAVYTWYEDQVISDVIGDLMVTEGITEKVAKNMVYYGGLQIQTCLDPDVQAVMDGVYENMENLPYISGSGQQLQSAMVMIDQNGNVVALSGGMGEKKGSRIFSRATTKRAPGSAFKPLSVYAPAIDMGLITPASVLDDTPYQINNGKPYPSNAYGFYKGTMTVREAVYRSSNCVAIKELTQLTPQASFDFLTGKMGFGESLVYSENRGGSIKSDVALAPLSMGGLTDGVSVMEMTGAYATFPRGGTYLKPRTYTQVLDANGNVLLDNTTDRIPTQVIKPTTAWYINSMLQDVVNGTKQGATGGEARLENMTVAGKTGSTNSNRDRWFVGYTPYYTAAVWTGYDQQERIKASGNPSAQLWKKVMSQVHQGLENKGFSAPDGVGEAAGYSVCMDSGMLASENCTIDPRGSRVHTEYFFSGDAPTQYCTVHGAPVKICTESPFLDAAGQPIGALYHLARTFCPEEKQVSVSLMDLSRDEATGGYAQDSAYTKAYLDNQKEGAYCTVHTEAVAPPPYDPALFDITNEATWPTEAQWPGFDSEKPETWPNTGEHPPVGVPTTPVPTPSPSPTPPDGPDETQPYLPVT